MKKNDHLDDLLQKVINNEIDNAPSPLLSKNEAWNKINKELSNDPPSSKKKSFFRRSLFVATCSLFFIIIVFQVTSTSSNAFFSITELYQKIQGSMTQIFGKNTDEINDNPSISNEFSISEESTYTTITVTLEEARQQIDFVLREPTYLPNSFDFKEASIVKVGDAPIREIYLNFENNEGQVITIHEKRADNNLAFGLFVDTDDNLVKNIMINENEGQIIKYKNQVNELIFIDQDYYFKISGEIAEENLIRIGNGLTPEFWTIAH